MASVQVNNNPTTINSNSQNEQIVRPVANFPPSLWGDRFASFVMDAKLSDMYSEEIKVLKEEARNMLISGDVLSEKLVLIDTIECLGLSYHFENEIKQQLTLAFDGHFKLEPEENDDLFVVSLQFRLLRQHALDAPSSIFKRFMDNNGELIKKTLVITTTDDDGVNGVLSLYEASHLRRQGEEIMDKAFSFSKAHLESVAPDLHESPFKKQVLHALHQSLQRGFPRVESRRFISLYEQVGCKNESLLRLAKLDFNLLQMLHKKELCEVTRWWKETNLISRLTYARDRAVECYFWSLGVYSEPQYSDARIILAKACAVLTVIDDTYDSYGTIEELEIFTDAVQKWDRSEIDRLPDYMKICYMAILDLYESFDAELSPKGRSYGVHYAKEAMKEIVRSYLVEAVWFIEGRLTSFDEYMSHAKITSGFYFVTATSFLGMDNATIEVFNWLLAKPEILEAGNTVVRIIDDIATYEVEKSRGQVLTGIDCYMKEHGLTKELAVEQLHEIAEKAWKDLNKGLMDNSMSSMEILIRGFNYARLVDVTYKYMQDGYTYPEKVVKPHIVALLVDSFKI